MHKMGCRHCKYTVCSQLNLKLPYWLKYFTCRIAKAKEKCLKLYKINKQEPLQESANSYSIYTVKLAGFSAIYTTY